MVVVGVAEVESGPYGIVIAAIVNEMGGRESTISRTNGSLWVWKMMEPRERACTVDTRGPA